MDKVKKNKIVRYGSTSLLIGAFIAYSGVKVYDFTIDHLHEYCPLNKFFGVKHQLNVINNDESKRYKAYFFKDGKGKIYSDYNNEYVPEGFTIDGDTAYKEMSFGTTNSIIITDNTVVIPDNENEKAEYYDPKVISVIRERKK